MMGHSRGRQARGISAGNPSRLQILKQNHNREYSYLAIAGSGKNRIIYTIDLRFISKLSSLSLLCASKKGKLGCMDQGMAIYCQFTTWY